MNFRILILLIVLLTGSAPAQERAVILARPVDGSPFIFDDQNDLFGKAWRWFLQGEAEMAGDSLKKLISASGYVLRPDAYYMVVAHFNDNMVPVGLMHGDGDFMSTRLYGLSQDNLYYIFITRSLEQPSYLSAMLTAKQSPFSQNLPAFLGLFFPIPGISGESLTFRTTVDVRQFRVPEPFRKNCDISIIVKKELADEYNLATAVFDNTAKERWSFGVATAITGAQDLDFIVGDDGTIMIRPKPYLDLAAFGVVNYHFSPVDTKAKTLAGSFHALAGVRLAQFFEPLIGIGAGFPADVVDVHFFAGMSVEFADVLKDGFAVGEKITQEIDPFKLKVRPKFRFGIELKFP